MSYINCTIKFFNNNKYNSIQSMKLSGKKLILLLLYSPEDEEPNVPISGRTRLTKMIFLFKEEISKDFCSDKNIEEIDFPEFFAWRYGPFSSDLMKDLEFLKNQGFIGIKFSNTPIQIAELEEYENWKGEYRINDIDGGFDDEYQEEVFYLIMGKGISKAGELWDQLTGNQQDILINFKRVLNRARLDRILEYVYRKYKKEGIKTMKLAG